MMGAAWYRLAARIAQNAIEIGSGMWVDFESIFFFGFTLTRIFFFDRMECDTL